MSYTKNTNTIIKFNRKNKVSAVNVSVWKILWNYICWLLAGKPDGWNVYE